VGETTKLTGGARVAVTEEEGVVAGLRKLEEEATFGKYAKAAQAGMGRAHTRGGLRCGAGQHGWGWAGWAEFWEKNSFRIKLDFWIYQGFGNL
jgi:hypothetical protein